MCLLNKIDFDKYLNNTENENYEYIREIIIINMADYTSYRIVNTLIGLDDFIGFYNNTNTKFQRYSQINSKKTNYINDYYY